MRCPSHSGAIKLWLYAVASFALAAWIAPLVFNAGQALAEVSSDKPTNEPLEHFAEVLRGTGFSAAFRATLLGCAVLLFLPWMNWLGSHPQSPESGTTGPWRLRLPWNARSTSAGQRLLRNLRGPWQCFAGFLIAAGLLATVGMSLVPSGFATIKTPPGGMAATFLACVTAAVIPATVLEWVFRGMAMGVFLRSMRPAAAIGMSALYFTAVLAVLPTQATPVSDPESSGAGFDLLKIHLLGFSDPAKLCVLVVPTLALGILLAYARWRTASLWMAIGLHTGWLAGSRMLASVSSTPVGTTTRMAAQCVAPLTALLAALVIVHLITRHRNEEESARS